MKKEDINYDYVTHRYAKEVVEGLRTCCELEKLSCARHLRDLEKQNTEGFPFVFDESRSDRVFDWFEKVCTHVRGVMSGEHISLQPFQYFDIGSVFGWVHKDTGKRRFTISYNQRARGNVKSTEMSGIALYGMCADAIYPPGLPEKRIYEMSPEIECAAVDREQAKRVWGDAALMAESSKEILKVLNVQKGKITHKKRGGFLRPLSKETKNKDSGAPCLVIIDEYHAHPTSEVKDVLKSGFGKRQQSLMLIISTAGKDAENNVCKKEYDIDKRILKGEIVAEDTFVMIRELEKGDDPCDEKTWVKANPILQHATAYSKILLEEIVSECNLAYESGDADKIREFLTKRCNLWQIGSEDKYMDGYMDKYKALAIPQNEFYQKINNMEVVLGYDLSKKIDLTAVGLVANLADGCVAVDAHGFVPAESLEKHKKTDKIPYDFWARDGWMTVTPGGVIDQKVMMDWVDTFCAKYNLTVKEDCFDPYNATMYMTNLQSREKRTVVEIRQGMITLSEPTHRFREMVAGKKIIHNGNPLLTWALSNAYSVSDSNGNIKLSKKNKDDTQRIDPIAAVINALSRLPQATAKRKSKYESDDLLAY